VFLEPIRSTENIKINIVKAELVAKKRGILVNKQRSRGEFVQQGYAALVTFRAGRDPRSSSASQSRVVSPAASFRLQPPRPHADWPPNDISSEP
jgi:D-3-phosphoglycerate dehydrogenase